MLYQRVSAARWIPVVLHSRKLVGAEALCCQGDLLLV